MGLKTEVPTTSLGIRSGVNCILLKSTSMILATNFAVNVLAMPGTPSIKTNDEHTIRLLSNRSQVDQQHIERLLTIDRYVNTRPAISNSDVISYYKKLNYFEENYH